MAACTLLHFVSKHRIRVQKRANMCFLRGKDGDEGDDGGCGEGDDDVAAVLVIRKPSNEA